MGSQRIFLRWTEAGGCPICHCGERAFIERHLGSDVFCTNCLAVYAGTESRSSTTPDYFTGMIYLEALVGGSRSDLDMNPLKLALEALKETAKDYDPH